MTLVSQPVVLHVSPHPDDELLGAGATLTLLRDAGWSVINLACSLGRPADQERRRQELAESCRRVGFDLILCDPPLGISVTDDLESSEGQLIETLISFLEDPRVVLVVGPQAHDRHHGHEVVGRSIARALERTARPMWWWAWGLWADLAHPTLYVPFDSTRCNEVAFALDAYVGECDRNRYRDLWPSRSVTNAVLGSERIFGFGSPSASDLPYAELLSERRFIRGEWVSGHCRLLSIESPLESSE